MTIAKPLPALPDGVKPFTVGWPVRLGDTDHDQRLRLDAIARYLQDIAYDHLKVAPDYEQHRGWVVRRTVIDVVEPILFDDLVEVRRWCSALSNRWCNMRVQIEGAHGGRVETEAFLIHFGEESGLPKRMSDAFMAPMLEMTTEHRLRWKAALSMEVPGEVAAIEFPLRVADVDWLAHVNNAVYLQAVEEVLGAHGGVPTMPYRCIIEYAKPLVAGEKLTLFAHRSDAGLDIWFDVEGDTRAVARIIGPDSELNGSLG
ncbi:acyl-[acyl-carrier-protein] thioesterase [Antrihabitans sp. YC2-6]|uniref:acyl-[acyl-carrier-protein] thioesterase n=1 Tax=Antrihabitans sp. YC2-6 TaxID=2799498 RepID=UPI0018F44D65|nr:acyl-ACP thioesterase domain-containing protein [Antrihabitans sp. YC2-6]MBJ8348236.1 acyl-[acyl-carrier-protein] thioesterase [Antrihabitans sp. YC2-6]